jgi:Flp pilus assembly protein TadD
MLGNNAMQDAAAAIRSERWADAASEAHASMRWAPWAAEPWRRLGQSQVATEQYAAAEHNLRKAIAKDPQNWDLWFDLALATLGNTQRRALAQAFALNPRSPELAEFRDAVIVPRVRATK